MYHFENFSVLANSKEFSVNDHPHMLMFHLSTKIKETNVSICASEYNFVSVKQIAERSANNNGLIGDVYLSNVVILVIFASNPNDKQLNFCWSYLFFLQMALDFLKHLDV